MDSPESNCGEGPIQNIMHILFECRWIKDEREAVQERLKERLCLAMLDVQEGMEQMIELWKEWQEV